jgi:hypothetical protein
MAAATKPTNQPKPERTVVNKTERITPNTTSKKNREVPASAIRVATTRAKIDASGPAAATNTARNFQLL